MPHQIANDILIPEMERMLNEGREVLFTPSGVSMRPFIEGGRDSVVLRRPSAPIRRGDILRQQYSAYPPRRYTAGAICSA